MFIKSHNWKAEDPYHYFNDSVCCVLTLLLCFKMIWYLYLSLYLQFSFDQVIIFQEKCRFFRESTLLWISQPSWLRLCPLNPVLQVPFYVIYVNISNKINVSNRNPRSLITFRDKWRLKTFPWEKVGYYIKRHFCQIY